MSSSFTFTSPGFSLQSVTKLGPNLVRVRFTQPPLRINPAGATDALNPLNWIFSGPSSVSAATVAVVAADTQSVDITTGAGLITGSWTLTVVNVKTAGAVSLTAPTSLAFTVADAETGLTAGAEGETAFSVIRKHLNQALAGPKWDALIAALSTADDYVWSLAASVFDQMFKSTASGKYLDILAQNDGNVRPANVGMGDEAFRELAIELATGRVTYNSLLRILQSFFGKEALRAYIDTSAGPFALVDGATVVFNFEGTEYIYEVDDRSFRTVSTASPTELAVALSMFFQHKKVGALASVVVVSGQEKVRIYSPSLGLRSKLTVTGGTAQAALGLDSSVHTIYNGTRTVAMSQTVDGALDVSVPAVADVTRNPANAAYILGNTPVEIIALERKNGTVTVQTSAAHNLVPGNRVLVEGYSQGHGRPWITSTASGNLGGGWVHGYATTGNISGVSTDFAFTRAASVVLSNGDIVLAGGEDLDTGVAQNLTVKVATPSVSQIADGTGANGATQVAFTITKLGALNAARYLPAASVLTGPLQDVVVITGGFASANALGTVEKLVGSTWTTVAPMATQRYNHAQVTLDGGNVLVIGGLPTHGVPLAVCEIYQPLLNSWIPAASLAIGRHGHKAFKLSDGKVFVVGGSDGLSQTVFECELYDPVANTWSKVRSAPIPLSGIIVSSFIALGNDEFLGIDNNTGTGGSVTAIYTYSTNTWRLGPTLNVAPSDIWNLVKKGSKIYAVDSSSGTWWLNLDDFSWNEINLPRTFSGSDRHRDFAVANDKIVLLSGGYPQARTYDVIVGDETGANPQGVNGLYSVLSTPSSNVFTYSTPVKSYSSMFGDTKLGGVQVYFAGIYLNGMRSAGASRVSNVTTMTFASPVLNVPQGTLAVYINSTSASFSSGVKVLTGWTSTTFTYDDPGANATASLIQVTVPELTGQYSVTTAAIGTGMYAVDPDAPTYATGDTTTSSVLTEGTQYGVLDVASTASFPDQEGWVVLGLGHSYESKPLKYLEKISSTKLLLEGFTADQTWPLGVSVTRIDPVGLDSIANALWITGSLAGQFAAEVDMRESVADDVTLNWSVIYPGDRGLGGEGQSNTDATAVWGPDDFNGDV